MWWLSAGDGAVERAEFGGEDAHGPGVGDDVVHRDGQHMVAGVEPDQCYAQQRATGQVKRPAGLCGQQLVQLGVLLGWGQV